MKQTRNAPQKRGSLGTPKNIRTNSRLYQITPKGRAWVLDHKTKLIGGVISEDVNLPRPTDEIDMLKIKATLLADYELMLTRLKLLPLDAYDEYKAAMDMIRRIRDTIYAIEQGLKP